MDKHFDLPLKLEIETPAELRALRTALVEFTESSVTASVNEHVAARLLLHRVEELNGKNG